MISNSPLIKRQDLRHTTSVNRPRRPGHLCRGCFLITGACACANGCGWVISSIVAKPRGNRSLVLAANAPISSLMENTDLLSNTQVLYNDTCPVCRFEIDSYRRLAEQRNLPIRFDRMAAAQDWGLSPDQAARRLHVSQNGQLLSGIPAFVALWSAMPRWRFVARLAALPGIHAAACFVYDRILAPMLYRAHLRRQQIDRNN